MNLPLFFADFVAVIHATYVLVVVVGLAAILVGAARGWRWVRNAYFRLIHLAMIAVVAVQALMGWLCPLTVLENYLRRLGSGPAYSESFLGHYAQQILYVDLPPWVFTMLHVGFGILVLAALFLIPPRWPRRDPA